MTVQGIKEHLQWWVGVAALAITAVFSYMLMHKDSDLPVPQLPAYGCPGQTQTYDSFEIDTTYQELGCQAMDPEVVVEMVESVHEADRQLQLLRLPALPTPMQIGIYTEGPDYALLGEPGGPRAMVLPIKDQLSYQYSILHAYQATAQMMIEEGAPGLDKAGARRLGRAYGYLLAPVPVEYPQDIDREIKLLQSHSIDYIPDLLQENCLRNCQWESLLAEQQAK